MSLPAQNVRVLGLAGLLIAVGGAGLVYGLTRSGSLNHPVTPAPAGFQLRSFNYDEPTLTKTQAQIDNNPQDPTNYVELAKLYLDQGRLSGDGEAYARAQAANDKALKLSKEFAPALIVKAAILNGLHRFTEAIPAAQAALKAIPDDPTSLGVLGSSYLEIGDQQHGAATIQQMVDLRPGFSAYALAGRVRFLEGDTPGAMELFNLSIQSVGSRKPDIAWASVQQANLYLTQGKFNDAKLLYQQALQLEPKYPYALAGLAKTEAALKDYPAAKADYERAIALIPQPEFHAELGHVYTKLNQPDQATDNYQIVEYIGQVNARNKLLYNRQLALFEADTERNPQLALQLARSEYANRQDIYGADALAWALFKNDQPQAAKKMAEVALHLTTQDPLLFYHAGMIAKVNHDTKKAVELLNKALTLNPEFDVIQADKARAALAELNLIKD